MLPCANHRSKEWKCQKPGIQKPSQTQTPDTGAAPKHCFHVARMSRRHLAYIFAHNEFFPDGNGVGIEHKPERKNSECEHSRPGKRRSTLKKKRSPVPPAFVKVPPCERNTNRQQLCKRFCKQGDSRNRSDQCGKNESRRKRPGAPREHHKEAEKYPERFGRIREEGPAVSIRAQKAQIERCGEQAGGEILASGLPRHESDQKSRKERPDEARPSQGEKRPPMPPVRGENALPEKQWWLGIDHVWHVRSQW